MTVKLSGTITIPEPYLEQARELLAQHINLTKLETGCLCFEVKPQLLKPEVFELKEEFVDRAAFEAHQTRTRSSAWGRFSENFARDYQIIDGTL